MRTVLLYNIIDWFTGPWNPGALHHEPLATRARHALACRIGGVASDFPAEHRGIQWRCEGQRVPSRALMKPGSKRSVDLGAVHADVGNPSSHRRAAECDQRAVPSGSEMTNLGRSARPQCPAWCSLPTAGGHWVAASEMAVIGRPLLDAMDDGF